MAVKLSNLIDLSKLGQNMLLVENPEPYTKYVDGNATDEVIGYKYSVILPDHSFDKIVVKVEQSTPLVSTEQIEKEKSIPVKFTDLEAVPYAFNGKVGLSFKAKSISVNK